MNAELEPLVQRHLDGTITAPEMARLNALLSVDAEARRLFVELANLDSALAALAAGWAEEPATTASPRLLRFPAPPVWLAAAACLALLLGGWWWSGGNENFARVEKAAGTIELVEGAYLRTEPHTIQAGTVALVTARGARVVIEAPAEFRFETAQRLRLISGRLAAEVPPPAKGFTVLTSSGEAVDLGTRFGVDVPPKGAAEIHVFQGEVIANATGAGAKQDLRGGDAVTLNAGATTARELRSGAFIQPDEVSGLTAALAAGQRAQSDAALEKLRRDPALISLLDFESALPLAGVFRMVQGRWPGTRAPEFVNVGDHLKLDAGGERTWPQLTLAAWVRLDRLGAPYQSLLHTDGWNQGRFGQVHWMITKRATMRLALFGNTLAPGEASKEGYPDSQTPVLPEQGRWVHLATVYDSEARTVRFYLNGRFDSECHQAVAYPARLGPAQIGNWDLQDRKLSGRIDEIALLGRALGDAEIKALYDAGNPYR